MNYCPVCGYDGLTEKPYDEFGYPTYTICSCCGYEFGFDDSSKGISFQEYQTKWISDGFKFFNKNKKPKIWNEKVLIDQLANITKVSYKPRLLRKRK